MKWSTQDLSLPSLCIYSAIRFLSSPCRMAFLLRQRLIGSCYYLLQNHSSPQTSKKKILNSSALLFIVDVVGRRHSLVIVGVYAVSRLPILALQKTSWWLCCRRTVAFLYRLIVICIPSPMSASSLLLSSLSAQRFVVVVFCRPRAYTL